MSATPHNELATDDSLHSKLRLRQKTQQVEVGARLRERYAGSQQGQSLVESRVRQSTKTATQHTLQENPRGTPKQILKTQRGRKETSTCRRLATSWCSFTAADSRSPTSHLSTRRFGLPRVVRRRSTSTRRGTSGENTSTRPLTVSPLRLPVTMADSLKCLPVALPSRDTQIQDVDEHEVRRPQLRLLFSLFHGQTRTLRGSESCSSSRLDTTRAASLSRRGGVGEALRRSSWTRALVRTEET